MITLKYTFFRTQFSSNSCSFCHRRFVHFALHTLSLRYIHVDQFDDNQFHRQHNKYWAYFTFKEDSFHKFAFLQKSRK